MRGRRADTEATSDAPDLSWPLRKVLDAVELAAPTRDRATDRDASARAFLGAAALAHAANHSAELDRALLLGRGHEPRVMEALRAQRSDLADAVQRLVEPLANLLTTVDALRKTLRRAGERDVALAASTALDWMHGSADVDDAVIDLMVDLARPMRGEVLFDPHCGDGLLVTRIAHELSAPTHQRVRVEARTSDRDLAMTATVVAYLHGIEAHVRVESEAPSTRQLSLDEPATPVITPAYARIVSFLEEPRRDRQSLWPRIGRALALLEPGGRAVLLLPTRTPLFHRRDAEDRRLMLDRNSVRAVIELPAARWSRWAHRGGALLVLEAPDASRPPAQTLAFARFPAPSDDDDEAEPSLGSPTSEVIADLRRALDPGGEPSDTVRVEHVHRDQFRSDDNLDPARWVRLGEPPTLEQAKAALARAEKEEREAAEAAEAALTRYSTR